MSATPERRGEDGEPSAFEQTFERGLEAMAGRIDPEASGIAGLKRLSGGASQELWRFDLIKGEAKRPVILRRAPGGDRVSGPRWGWKTRPP